MGKGDEFQAEEAARRITRESELGFGANPLDVSTLFQVLETTTVAAKQKLREIEAHKDAISIADMFEMQMMMNHLSQMSEMSSSVVGAMNQAITTMARGVKG